MLYLRQDFDIDPASPSTRDRFVEAVRAQWLPAAEKLGGARLVGAWFHHEEWYSQLMHVTEFDDWAALGAWREALRVPGALAEAHAALEQLAPHRHAELLEPLGPIEPARLHQAIAGARAEPVGVWTFAVLDVAPGQMERFTAMLAAARDALPIVAAWRQLTGSPDRVIDLWKGDLGREGYRPSDPGQDAFFAALRQVAPRERMLRLHPLPYSPLA